MAGEPKLIQAWGVIRGVLKDLSFDTIKDIAGRSGLDITLLSNLQQAQGSTKDQLLSELDCQIRELKLDDEVNLSNYLKIIAENIVKEKPALENILEKDLEKLGWQFIGGDLVPIDLLNNNELKDLPESAHKDLGRAADRLWIGDLDGAITSACGALDNAMETIIEEEGITINKTDGFQNKYKKVLKSKGTMEKLKNDLTDLGWQENDASQLVKNLKGSLNQGAYVMQSLRNKMGDTHGTKDVLKPIAYDSIKWAALMLRMLK